MEKEHRDEGAHMNLRVSLSDETMRKEQDNCHEKRGKEVHMEPGKRRHVM